MSADDRIPASDISDALVRLQLQVGERRNTGSEPAEQPQAKDGNPKSEGLPIKTDPRLLSPRCSIPKT